MSRETSRLHTENRKHLRPGERAARFILRITAWIRDIYASPTTVVPRGRVLLHQGASLPPEKTLRYPHILLVEDNPVTAGEFVEVVRNHYDVGSVKIFVAHTYDAAVTFFADEPVDLVIMDADLDDAEGDGATLTREFLSRRPELVILANSSNRLSNLRLCGSGARETLGKSTEKLRSWLLRNDPAGAGG